MVPVGMKTLILALLVPYSTYKATQDHKTYHFHYESVLRQRARRGEQASTQWLSGSPTATSGRGMLRVGFALLISPPVPLCEEDVWPSAAQSLEQQGLWWDSSTGSIPLKDVHSYVAPDQASHPGANTPLCCSIHHGPSSTHRGRDTAPLCLRYLIRHAEAESSRDC